MAAPIVINPSEDTTKSCARTATWVIVPAFNEARRIGSVVGSLVSCGWTVVVIDDGSADDTSAKSLEKGAIVLRHLLNRGQGAALQTGLEFAREQGAQVIVTFDADGQHDVEDAAAMVRQLLHRKLDVVLGSRFLGSTVNMPWHRWVLLKLAVLFTRVTTRLPITDTHNGLRVLTAEAAAAIQLREDRMAHASEFLHEIAAKRLRYDEHPVTIRYQAETLEKGQRTWDALRVLSRVMISRIFAS